jgi:hypothetical protein
MRRLARSPFITSLPAGFAVGLLGALILAQPPWLAFICAAGSALLFGVVLGAVRPAVLGAQHRRVSALPLLSPGEEVLKAGAASHSDGSDTTGGLLVLTSQRVVFRAAAQARDVSLPLGQLVRAEAEMTAWMHATGLHLQTREGQVERFVVPEREREAWAEAIRAARPARDES